MELPLLGNNADSGQFVLGQPENSKNWKSELRLPTAAELFPELVEPKLERTGQAAILQHT